MARAKRFRIKEFPVYLTDEDVMDVKLFQKGKEIAKFSLNYRAFIKDKWHDVYRIDSYHDYVHEQKFWKSEKPIPLPRFTSIVTGYEIKWYMQQIKGNFEHYRRLFEKKC
ncbi:MAG: hypothetical protein NT130_03845 [Candidatus Micrarchaeota archaeon]|nr:hypothetical protein [Candidatus Micrarchaeota archaeon]